MKIFEKRTTWIAGFAALCLALPGFASVPQDDDEKKDETKDEEATEEEEDKEEWMAVVGGDVYTGTGSLLRGATVLSKEGKIEEIGYDLHIPEDAEVLDATGYHVYPGLVAISSFGLFGGSSDLANTVNPFSSNMILGLAAGITSAVNGSEAAKLKTGEIEGVVMKGSVFTTLSFAKTSPSGKRSLREKFAAAAAYLREYRQWEIDVKKDKELKEPKKTGIDSNVLAVLKGEKRPSFVSNDRTDLTEIANLAIQYGFRPIIRGCREGWTVADHLGRAGAAAIVTPRDRRPKNESYVRDGGSSIENAAKLHAAGVQVAIIPASAGISLGGIVGRDLMHLTVEAGFAVRGGLPDAAAIEGITIVPARLMGVDHRIGSLEVGKDADMIVTDGDILHYQTFVQWAVVDGKIAYDKEEELYFAHIRPRPESEVAPEVKLDVGETEEEEGGEDEEKDEGDGDG